MDNVVDYLTGDTGYFFADLVRFVLVVIASLLVGATARVVQQYYRASRRAFKQGDFRGLLPTHVWLIGLSYILLILGTVSQHILHLGDRPDFYLAMNSAAYTCGAIALWLILRYENRRVKDGHLEDRRKREEARLQDLTTREFKIMRQSQRRRESDHREGTDE